MMNNLCNANKTEEKVSITEQQAREELILTLEKFKAIKEPKYRNADVSELKANLQRVYELKDNINDHKLLDGLIKGLSLVINRIERENDSGNGWRNMSERTLNKVIQPITMGKEYPAERPFEWQDSKKQSHFIKKGNWGARNVMVMDALGHLYLRKAGKGSIPKKEHPLFKNKTEVMFSEDECANSKQNQTSGFNLELIPGSGHHIKFNDRHFRKLTSLDLSSNEIYSLICKTSQVEFMLNYSYRIYYEKTFREVPYQMKHFSRPFEFWHEVIQKRKDGIVQLRMYYISFNTFLGKLFTHNLLMRNYDWLDSRFYSLPLNAQNFYRQFILHNDYKHIQILYNTIRYRLNLHDKNITNQIRTIENSILQPLVKHGYIDSYEKGKSLLNGIKYTIKRPEKKGFFSNSLCQDERTEDVSSEAKSENH